MRAPALLLAAAAALAARAGAQQHPFLDSAFGTMGTVSVTLANGTVLTPHTHPAFAFADVGGAWSAADALDGAAFAVVRHPAHPGTQVRVKRTEFCDATVKVYTGYLDVDDGAKHLFFYYFESRRDPAKDDVLMWINGGPGCSSATGLLMELGPCRIDMGGTSANGTLWNPHGWNAAANVFFLDQPVGVGFSYVEHGETVETTEEAARNADAFVRTFFAAFGLRGRKFHMSGESYAGRYLPVFAAEVVDNNARLRAQNNTDDVINLDSVIIGNGNTDPSAIYAGKYDIECGTAALPVPVQSISTCVQMKHALPRCLARMRAGCVAAFDALECGAAVAFCSAHIEAPYHASGRNPFDITKPCVGELCYAEGGAISALLNTPEVRKTLGVTAPGNFTGCSEDVGWRFASHLDKYAHPTHEYVAGLLERGVRVLIYAGTYDWQCNWVSNRIWVDALQWTHGAAFRAAPYRAWRASAGSDGADAAAGETKRAGGLTFATVRGAGHMVPYDKPIESLAMVNRWMRAEPL